MFGINCKDLVRDLKRATAALDKVPPDAEFTAHDVADLDDIRHAATRLADMAEAVLADFNGQTRKK